jgi:hypothetical protein
MGRGMANMRDPDVKYGLQDPDGMVSLFDQDHILLGRQTTQYCVMWNINVIKEGGVSTHGDEKEGR